MNIAPTQESWAKENQAPMGTGRKAHCLIRHFHCSGTHRPCLVSTYQAMRKLVLREGGQNEFFPSAASQRTHTCVWT